MRSLLNHKTFHVRRDEGLHSIVPTQTLFFLVALMDNSKTEGCLWILTGCIVEFRCCFVWFCSFFFSCNGNDELKSVIVRLM